MQVLLGDMFNHSIPVHCWRSRRQKERGPVVTPGQSRTERTPYRSSPQCYCSSGPDGQLAPTGKTGNQQQAASQRATSKARKEQAYTL